MKRFAYSVATAFTVISGLLLVAPAYAATPAACSTVPANTPGFYGSYFNLSVNDPGMYSGRYTRNLETSAILVGGANSWYEPQYLSFGRIDPSAHFSTNPLPLNEGKEGDPYHFAVYWRARMVVPASGNYSFSTASDDDSWVIIDGNVVVDNGGLHGQTLKSGSINLNAGDHIIDVYYAERRPGGAAIEFKANSSLLFYALPPSCDGLSSGGQNGGSNNNQTTNSGSGTSAPAGRVAGISTAAYTPAIALYRVIGTPDIYAIFANGRRHHISGPAAFEKYGYKYTDVKDVSLAEFNKHRDVQLVRTPEDSLVFFLSARGNRQWLKIPLFTPTVFASYESNYWGDVVVIDELDLRTYQNVELVREMTSNTIWLLEKNERRQFTTEQVMIDLGYNPHEALIITETHLDSFLEGEPIG